jgi:HPt (histidine-containing phosphotransfer) domain-containing protein
MGGMQRGSTAPHIEPTVKGRVKDYAASVRAPCADQGVFAGLRRADTTCVTSGRIPPGQSGAAASVPDMDDALRTIWARHRPVALERVAVLERAAEALREERLDDALCEQARSAAHRLAGSLGTFGLGAATEQARRAERLLDGAAAAGGSPGTALGQLATALRTLVEDAVTPASVPDVPATGGGLPWGRRDRDCVRVAGSHA